MLLSGKLQEWSNGSNNVQKQRQGPAIYGCFGSENGHFVMSIRHLWTRVMAPMTPWPCHLVAGQGLCQKYIPELTIHSLTMAFLFRNGKTMAKNTIFSHF